MHAGKTLFLVVALLIAPAARAQSFDEPSPRPPAGSLEVRSVHGPLALREARQAAAGARAALTRCARRRVRDRETMTAESVDLDIVVAGDGRVARIDLPDLDPDEQTPAIRGWRRCAGRALRRLRFPEAAGPSTVEIALVFFRGDDAGGVHGWRGR